MKQTIRIKKRKKSNPTYQSIRKAISDADTLGQAENYLDSAIAAARGGPA